MTGSGRALLLAVAVLAMAVRGSAAEDHPSPAAGASHPAGESASTNDGSSPAGGRFGTITSSGPFATLRRMIAMQERVVRGDGRSYRKLPELLETIGEEIRSAASEVWADRRNREALALYLLVGGDPEAVRAAVATVPDSAEWPEARLITAAIALAEGHRDRAALEFEEIDPAAFPDVLAAHIALTKGMLTAAKSAETALASFDAARRLLPGSLAEEAALRQGAVIAGRAGAYAQFRTLSRLYMRRYARSIYAGDFQKQVALLLLELYDRGERPDLDMVTDGFEDIFRRDFYLLLARRALLAGDRDTAAPVAAKAMDLAAGDAGSAARAALYAAAAELLSGEAESAHARLKTIDLAALPDRDRPLMLAVLDLGQVVQAPVDPGSEDLAILTEAKTRARSATPFESPMLQKAMAAVDQADVVLKEAAHD